MIFENHIFKNPVKVIQIFRNINVYGKSDKSYSDRKDKLAWKNISSKSGFVLHDDLYLPGSILKNPDFKNCDLVTIEDDNQPVSFSSSDLKFQMVIASNHTAPTNQCFNSLRPNKIDIFELRKNTFFELHLLYGHFEIGIPERKNFKICEIKLHKPIEIKINGKTDFSLTGRHGARIFKEQDFIFEYLGDFDGCKLIKEPTEPYMKHIPSERKVVDLIKELW